MKKKLFFEPKRNSPLDEYIDIKYGKIRTLHFLQGIDQQQQKFAGIIQGLEGKKIDTYKPEYKVIKYFNLAPKLKKVDKYMKSVKNLKYTHELIIPKGNEVQNWFSNLKSDQTKIDIPPEMILQMVFSKYRIFVKLNLWEQLVLKYYSFSWSSLDTNQKITIIGIITASVISVLAIIFN